MKLWIDDVRLPPDPKEYTWLKYVDEAIAFIEARERRIKKLNSQGILSDNRQKELSIELIDLGHDAGSCARYGGDYIEILNWLEETGRNYPIHIHSMNPVGIENMRRIIERNGWTEVR